MSLTVLVSGIATAAPVRAEVEKRMSDLLSQKVVVFIVPEPETIPRPEDWRPYRTETLFEDVESEGALVSQTTVSFEGCILVQHLERPMGPVNDERIDLSYLVTDPSEVATEPPSPDFPGLGATVIFPLIPEVSKRLIRVHEKAGRLRDEGYALYPTEILTRLHWLARKYEMELHDKIYLNAGEVTYHEQGITIASPSVTNSWRGWRFYVDPGGAEEFVELAHLYATNFCAAARI